MNLNRVIVSVAKDMNDLLFIFSGAVMLTCGIGLGTSGLSFGYGVGAEVMVIGCQSGSCQFWFWIDHLNMITYVVGTSGFDGLEKK
ncbi:unnamed protein product [Sphenostylis stenocarpa]|uniref:Uncharacterized protein n=1 Tax=Sphenostylis stenocarpa TaxID=92480 RepID=A0AA86VTE5_9FABA|nr:unnamed protein product [Sphenostylis stenocarpa]